jgi:peptidyl-prolyl cis-trans isomerase D
VYWVRLDDIQETRSRPLSEIRDEVLAQWEKTERQRLLEAMAEHLAEKGNSSRNFEDIEADLGRKAFTSEQLTRQSRNETFSAEGISRIFAARADEFVWAPVGFGGSLIVMQVDKVIAPSRDNDQSVATIYDNERERFRGDLTNQFISSLQTSMGVSVDTVALQKALQAN